MRWLVVVTLLSACSLSEFDRFYLVPDAAPPGPDAAIDADPGCAMTCAGCCSGQTCLPGGESSACGMRGAACSVCSPQQICANATCQSCGHSGEPCCTGTCIPGNTCETTSCWTNDVWAVGDNGTILHWTGSAWSSEQSPTSRNLYGLWSDDALTMMMAVGDEVIVERQQGAWSVKTMPTGVFLRGVWSGIAVGIDAQGNGLIYSRSPQGTGFWTAMNAGTLPGLASVSGSAGNDVWAVGNTGRIEHYDLISWQQVPSPTSDDLTAVFARTNSDAWATSANGAVLRWNGSQWHLVYQAGFGLNGISASAANDVWAVSQTKALHWDGMTWQALDTGMTSDHWLFAAWAGSPGEVWVVGGRPMISFMLPLTIVEAHFSSAGWMVFTQGPQFPLHAVWGVVH